MKIFTIKNFLLLFLLGLVSYYAVDQTVYKWRIEQNSIQSQTVGDYHIPRDHASFDDKGRLTDIWIKAEINKSGKIDLLGFGNYDHSRTTIVQNFYENLSSQIVFKSEEYPWMVYKLIDDDKYHHQTRVFQSNNTHILADCYTPIEEDNYCKVRVNLLDIRIGFYMIISSLNIDKILPTLESVRSRLEEWRVKR